MPSLITKEAIATLPADLRDFLTVEDEGILSVTIKMPVEHVERLCALASADNADNMNALLLEEARSERDVAKDDLRDLTIAVKDSARMIFDAVKKMEVDPLDEPYASVAAQIDRLIDAASVFVS